MRFSKIFHFKYRYPKLTLLIIAVIFAYYIFSNSVTKNFVLNLNELSYLGVFISGILFSFGFTAPFAVGFLIALNPSSPGNLLLFSLIGGLGSVVSDLLIFNFIRVSFMNEFKRIEKTKIIQNLNKLTEKRALKRIKVYLMYVFAGIIIASPLPDEVGVTMLAGLTRIKLFALAILSFILNTIGIIIFLNL